MEKNKVQIKLCAQHMDKVLQEGKQVIMIGESGTGTIDFARKYVAEELGKQYDNLSGEKKEEYKIAYDQEHLHSVGGYPYTKVDDPIYKEDYVKKHMKFAAFHPDYKYEDFIEGIHPMQNKEGNMIQVKLDGSFKKFCRNIVENNPSKEEKYFFIIDRINDVNIGQVFGEAMFGLDEFHRGKENRFDTKYQNIPSCQTKRTKAGYLDNDCFNDGFYIPENLYIIATMSTPQYSFMMNNFNDNELYKYFQIVEVRANEEMEHTLLEMLNGVIDENEIKSLSERVCNMNHILAEHNNKATSDQSKIQIGPTYFRTYNGNNLAHIFEHHIAFAIKGYLREQFPEDQDFDLLERCWKALNGIK